MSSFLNMPLTIFKSICLSFVFTFLLIEVNAQSQAANNWYFGNNNNSIRFIRPNYIPENVTLSNILGRGMGAVASGPTSGGILFYTDGDRVYDRTDGQMLGGIGLGGSSDFDQGIAISAIPGPDEQYYIFTVNAGSNLLEYAQVDMTQNSVGGIGAPPLGEVISTNNTAGLPPTPRSPAVLIIANDTRDAFWLISHEAGTNNYDITEIDNTGNISSSTVPLASAPDTPVNFSYNYTAHLLAIASSDPVDGVTLLDFDNAAGTLTFNSTIVNTENAFDTEWSINGQYLYVSGELGGTATLYQADLDAAPVTLQPVSTLDDGTDIMTTSLGLQMAPDSLIYHIYEDSNGLFRVGRLNAPDTIASQTLYDPSPIGDENYEGRQFPAFLPPHNILENVDFTFSGTCANAPTFFFPAITPPADSVRWNFGDESFSTQLGPTYTYTEAGPYNVTLTAYISGDSLLSTQPINIQEFDIQFSEPPQSDTVCFEDFPVTYTAQTSGSTTGVTYQWGHEENPGATTTIDSAGHYFVVATAPNGCEAYAPLQVVEYGLIQQTANVWYFGNNAGIDFNPVVDVFNPGPPQGIDFGDPNSFNGGNKMVAPEGCAIYGDNNGQVLFYSNGEEIYDREGTPITEGAGIGGNTDATQSVFIVPFPGDATLWYVFLTSEVYDEDEGIYQLDYVVFDLKEKNGLGDLLRDGSNDVQITTLYEGTTERITGNNNWAIVHEYGTNNFLSFPVTNIGIGTPVVSNVGSVHQTTQARQGQGYMKLANGDRIAVALSVSDNENYVEVFNFDNTTGEITNPIQLEITGVPGQVYGTSFSPGMTNLFATVKRGGPETGEGEIVYWEIDSIDTDLDYVVNTFSLLTDSQVTGAQLGALQQAPDGTIYVAKTNAPALSTITNPEGKNTSDPPSPPLYNDEAQAIGNDLVNNDGANTSELGLPNFIDQNTVNPQQTVLSTPDGCIGDQLTFNVTNPVSLETYRWNIMDENRQSTGVGGSGTSLSFSLNVPGNYIARVDIITECDSIRNPDGNFPAPVEQLFTIYENPAFALTPNDVTGACGNANGSIDVTFTATGSFTYTVNGPVPTPTTEITSSSFPIQNLMAGSYRVTITNAITGCSTFHSTIINEPAPFQVTATPDPANCDGQDGSILVELSANPSAPAYPVSYTLANENTGNVIETGIDDNSDGDNTFEISPINEGTYAITVTESGGSGCSFTAGNISVNTPPEATLTIPTDFAACDVPQARIGLTSNADPTTWLVNGPDNGAFFDGDTLVVNLDGNYTVTVGNDEDGSQLCANSEIVSVTFSNSSENPFAGQYTICPQEGVPADERFVKFENPPAGFIAATWYDSDGAEITGSEANYQFTSDSLIIAIDGPVRAELENPFGCITIADINIIEDCRARINAPTAFRPGSGIPGNRSWKVFPLLVSSDDFEIFIYNRWGELIFQSTDLQFMVGSGWNGGYNNDPNRPVQGGTYAYKVQFKNNFEDNAEIQERRGGITIVR